MTTGATSGAASSGFASEIAEGAEVFSAAGAAGEPGGTSADGASTGCADGASAGFWEAGEASTLAGVASGAGSAVALAAGASAAGGSSAVAEMAWGASAANGSSSAVRVASGASGARGVPEAAGAALGASSASALTGAVSGEGAAVALAEAASATSDSSAVPGNLRAPVLPADSATTDLLVTARKSPLLKQTSREIFSAAEPSAPTSVPEARPARSWEVLVPWSALEALAKERTPVAAMSASSPSLKFSLGENGSRTRLGTAFEPWTPATSGKAAEARSPTELRSQVRSAESGREPRPASRASSGPDSLRPSARGHSSAERDSPPQPESEPPTRLRSLTPPSQLRPETPSTPLTEPSQETPPEPPSTQLRPATPEPSKLRPPTRLRPTDPPSPADPAHPLAKLTALPGVSTASTVAAERASRADWGQAAGRMLPVAPALADLLPGAGLRRGSVVAVHHSTSLLFALLAEATAAGAWAAVVGAPSLGIVAAAEHGVVVSRLALVPQPGAEYPAVMAALLDGVDLVVTEPRSVRPDVARRLAARARHRGAVLLSLGPWPSADVELHCTPGTWTGVLEHGAGHLRSRPVEVHARGRGAAARPRSASVLLPGQDGRVSRGEKRVAAREEAVG